MANEETRRRLSRRDFLKLSAIGAGAAFEASNSLLGKYLSGIEPEVPRAENALSEYKIAWQAKPWVWINLAIASQHIDGRVINPKEEVSLIDLMKLKSMKDVPRDNIDPRKGYIAAQMSDPSKLDGWGYGLCLAATSIFRACLNSPLRITERGTHYEIYPDYFKDMPVGTDAAVFYPDRGDSVPLTDLKLENPTNSNLALCFKIFDLNGNKLAVPDGQLSEVWYKATYLDHLIKVLRRELNEQTDIDLPKQYIPEYVFGNKDIWVYAAVTGKKIDYKVDLEPAGRSNPILVSGKRQYAFNRQLKVADSFGTWKSYSETFVSQYGEP